MTHDLFSASYGNSSRCVLVPPSARPEVQDFTASYSLLLPPQGTLLTADTAVIKWWPWHWSTPSIFQTLSWVPLGIIPCTESTNFFLDLVFYLHFTHLLVTVEYFPAWQVFHFKDVFFSHLPKASLHRTISEIFHSTNTECLPCTWLTRWAGRRSDVYDQPVPHF